jgi:RNA polymerase sigma-70 factor, ECF subfamily
VHADETAARLHELLLHTARGEISRRRAALPIGDLDADELAQHVAKSVLATITASLAEHDGRSPLTIWASKYVVAEISAEIARLAWRTLSMPADREQWERLPGLLGLRAGEQADWGRALATLRRAVDEDLSEQQRAAFMAVTLGNVSADVLAMELGSTRNAIYKALFEARRQLRSSLAADGYDLEPLTRPLLAGPPGLDRLLGVTQGDAGCDITFQHLDGYVDAERRGLDPARNYAPVAVHLRGCDLCHQDYKGVLAASRGSAARP